MQTRQSSDPYAVHMRRVSVFCSLPKSSCLKLWRNELWTLSIDNAYGIRSTMYLTNLSSNLPWATILQKQCIVFHDTWSQMWQYAWQTNKTDCISDKWLDNSEWVVNWKNFVWNTKIQIWVLGVRRGFKRVRRNTPHVVHLWELLSSIFTNINTYFKVIFLNLEIRCSCKNNIIERDFTLSEIIIVHNIDHTLECRWSSWVNSKVFAECDLTVILSQGISVQCKFYTRQHVITDIEHVFIEFLYDFFFFSL